MIYGYARISKPKQSIDRQIRNIKRIYPTAYIIKEAYTGRSLNRPEWTKLKRLLKSGDTVVFDSVSRMSRGAKDGYTLYEELFAMGVNLVFLKEPHINTAVYRDAIDKQIKVTIQSGDAEADALMTAVIGALNTYILALAKKQIYLAFEQAQKEVDDLSQRTKEGLQTARLNGKQIGRARGGKNHVKIKAPAQAKIKKYCRDFGGALTDKEAIKLIGIDRKTYYKYKKELKDELCK